MKLLSAGTININYLHDQHPGYTVYLRLLTINMWLSFAHNCRYLLLIFEVYSCAGVVGWGRGGLKCILTSFTYYTPGSITGICILYILFSFYTYQFIFHINIQIFQIFFGNVRSHSRRLHPGFKRSVYRLNWD